MPPSDVLHQMSGVMRPSFSEKIVDGTADSMRLQVSMLAAPIGRSAH
jgi:hypothetical protein